MTLKNIRTNSYGVMGQYEKNKSDHCFRIEAGCDKNGSAGSGATEKRSV
jgi:hypothetical protein